jgi:hypothetical protein
MSSSAPSSTPISYKDAGVDIVAGDALVERIKPLARKTMREGLQAGEKVMVDGFQKLQMLPPGTPVKPVPWQPEATGAQKPAGAAAPAAPQAAADAKPADPADKK